MDCIHARLLIVLLSREPHELDAEARAALEQHLEQCAACLAWSHQEDRVDGTLRQAIQSVPVPATLPSKILHELEQRRPPRRRATWIAAAAACLLTALSIGGFVWWTQPPELQFVDIEKHSGYVALKSAEAVEESFADQGVTLTAPVDFNYDLYSWSGLVSLKGRQVPRIDFFHRGDGEAASAVAHVYVLAEDTFDVDELVALVPSPTPAHNHNHMIQLIQRDHFIYIAVYTSSSLRPFLTRLPGSV
jgi:hypothetical protein